MANEETKNAKKDEKQTAVPIVECENNEIRIVCPVCGHANPNYTAICKMCSNYLS